MRGARRRRVETDDEDEDEEEEISTEAQLKELKRREAWLKKELKKMQKSRTKRSSAGKSRVSSSEDDDSEPRGSKKTPVKRKNSSKKKKRKQQDRSTTDSSSKDELDSSKESDSEPHTSKKSPVKRKKWKGKKTRREERSGTESSDKDELRNSEKITMVTISNTKDVTTVGDPANKEEVEAKKDTNIKRDEEQKQVSIGPVSPNMENKKLKQINKKIVLTKPNKEDPVTISDDSEMASPRDNHARREVKQTDGEEEAKGKGKEEAKEEGKEEANGSVETSSKEGETKGEERDSKMQKAEMHPRDAQINMHCNEEDLNFIEHRIKNDNPAIYLRGKIIEEDTMHLSNLAKKATFDINKIKSEPSIRPCKYYKLSNCHVNNVLEHTVTKKEGSKEKTRQEKRRQDMKTESGEAAAKENMQERGEGGGKESEAEEEEGRNVKNPNEREDVKRGSKMTPLQPTKKELGKEAEKENPEKGGEDKKTEFETKGKEGRHDRNSKEASSKIRMESTSKEKSRHRREGDKHTMVSTSREKRRNEGEEGEKPPKNRKGSEPLEYETFACYATEEDRRFIENRSAYRTEDPSEQLQEQVPTVELAGRDIYKDMARIESCMKQSYFSLERVAKSTATGLRMCPFYNLKACSFAQATHINGTREVAHFCISCYTSANVLLGHPVQECPNLNVRIRR